eukprot:NODE_8225_length_366_cov_185.085174_g6487_i0.p3 GENE.NODE_8225_length_366_cov_185.085174_g6487_i0~~NODE_8225_length_366_cov_185.085174_g6487_i0.p3  ORF type:complete len:104 (-),score=45.52 NODE_8225_length_366_cov_185.085174_g6487_i0:55-345(-)
MGAHPDGTVLAQTVRREDDPFLHALLTQVGRRSGVPVLVLAPFLNGRGIRVSRIREALAVLQEAPFLDALVVEDTCFSRHVLKPCKPLRPAALLTL